MGMDADPREDDLWVALDRYVAGDAHPEEIERVRRWLGADPSRQQVVDDIRRFYDIGGRRPPMRTADDAWRAAAQAMRPARPVAPQLTPRRWNAPLSAAAAVVLVALGVAVAPRIQRTLERGHSQVAVSPAPARVFATQRGQRAEIRLTDGTLVTLAAESRLTIPAAFDSLDRAVVLEGQGYFDVASDTARPFVVRTHTAVVRDLGTRFNVRAFANESKVRVVVTQGKVELGHILSFADSARALVAGDLGMVDENGTVAVSKGVDTTHFVSWTRGVLAFDRTPVPEALADFARWYDLEVHLSDPSLKKLTLTVSLRNRSLAEALDVVALLLHADVARNGRVVTLTSSP
jgi:transmembrane sensor